VGFFGDIAWSVLRYTVSDYRFGSIKLSLSIYAWYIYQYLVEIYSVSAEKIISDAFSYSENV